MCGDGGDAVPQHQVPGAAGEDVVSGQTPGETPHCIHNPGKNYRLCKYWMKPMWKCLEAEAILSIGQTPLVAERGLIVYKLKRK